jgi:predicted dehydrogenase
VKVGVLGCGYWGPNLLRNLVETNRCSQTFCFDKDAAVLGKVLRRHSSVHAAKSAEDLIQQCDAVMVATPVSTHYAVAKQVLEAGKSVFVEKPLTTSSEHAHELVQLAASKNLVLMVGHTFIYSPPVRKVKQYIADGTLGELYFLSSLRVNLGIHQKDVDVLWDLAPHDISILLYWIGEMPERVSAVGRACVGNMPDIAAVHMEFPNGTLANVEMSWLSPRKMRRTFVVGSKSMVIYDDMDANEKVRLYDKGVSLKNPNSFGEYQLTYRTGDMISPKIDSSEPLFVEVTHFLDCVKDCTRPLSDGRSGLAVVATIEAASRSLRSNGRFIDIPQIDKASSGAEANPLVMAAAATQRM